MIEVVEGDALRVLPTLAEGRFDLVTTDPPYSSGGATRGDRVQVTSSKYVRNDSRFQALDDFDGDTRDQRGFAYWSTLWFSELLRVAKDGAACLVFVDWRQLPTMTDAIQAGGWVWRGIVPWNKTEASRPQLGRPRAQCEYVVYGTKGPHKPYDGAPPVPGFFECPVERDRVHQTQKPLALMMELVMLAPPGGEVLDAFAGSGTTGVACIRQGRRGLLIESSSAVARVCRDRIDAELRGQSIQDARAGQEALFR